MFNENMVDFPVTYVSEPCKNFRSFRDGFVELTPPPLPLDSQVGLGHLATGTTEGSPGFEGDW